MKFKKNILFLLILFFLLVFVLFFYLLSNDSLFFNKKIISNSKKEISKNLPKNSDDQFLDSKNQLKNDRKHNEDLNKEDFNKTNGDIAINNKKPSSKDDNAKVDLSFRDSLISIKRDDMYIGNIDSDLIIFEYTSVTCPHCKRYHLSSFPEIKEKFIKNNKILYVFRDFPTDVISFRVSLLLNSMKDLTMEKKINLREFIMSNQDQILKTIYENRKNPKQAFDSALSILREIFLNSTGISKEKFEDVINVELPETKKNADEIIANLDILSKFLGGEIGAPTFIIFNKKTSAFKKLEGVKKFEDFEDVIDSLQ